MGDPVSILGTHEKMIRENLVLFMRFFNAGKYAGVLKSPFFPVIGRERRRNENTEQHYRGKDQGMQEEDGVFAGKAGGDAVPCKDYCQQV